MVTEQMLKKARREDAFGNRVLYEMCERYPSHDNDDEISGKV